MPDLPLLPCLILDDEEPARRELRMMLANAPGAEVVAEAGDVESALALCRELEPQLVFVDIQLLGESGFDFVARLPQPAPGVVFVTAFDQFAIRAFECNALHYLLKPVRRERLAEALERARALQEAPAPKRPAQADDVIFLKNGNSIRWVPWRDIVSILSEGNYTRVNLATPGDGYLILRPLKRWLELAPEALLAQTHRTALVNLRHVREIRRLPNGRHEIHLSTGQVLPLGKSFATQLLRDEV